MLAQLPRGRGFFIAEKGEAMKEFKKVYEKIKHTLPYTLDFGRFSGHVVELANPGQINPEWREFSMDHLPMIPDKWEYFPTEGIDFKTGKKTGKVNQFYTQTKESLDSGNYDFIVCGTDPEREGNLIFDAFMSTMTPNVQAKDKYRFWNNGMSDKEIQKGFENLLRFSDKISQNTGTVQDLSNAAFLRAKTDWLIGLNGTQAISSLAGFTVNTGRVLNPVENLIVQRELQIRNFKPEQFFTIQQKFSQNGGEFVGTLIDESGKPVRFASEVEAEQKLKEIQSLSSSAKITEVNMKRAKETAPSFYSTSLIQGVASELYKYKPKYTDEILESLYLKKITTYPRVDTTVITEKMADEMPGVFNTAYVYPEFRAVSISAEKLASFKKNKTYVNDEKVGAHEAIQPLPEISINLGALTDDEKNILYLICRSQILPFVGDVLIDKTVIKVQVGDFVFRANGSRLVDPGWSTYVPEKKFRDTMLPDLKEGAVSLFDGSISEGWTTPPKEYSVTELNNILENIHRLITDDEKKLAIKKAEGLGRPSTRAEIIEKLINHDRITMNKNEKYRATNFGIEVVTKLRGNDLLSPELSARLETKLQDVELGILSVDDYYKYVVRFTENFVSELRGRNFSFNEIPEYAQKQQPQMVCLIKSTSSQVFEGKEAFYDQNFLEWVSERQEAVNNDLPIPDFRGFYLKKKFETSKFKMKREFTQKDIISLTNFEVIEKEFIWLESKNTSKTKLKLDDDFRLVFVKSESNQEISEFSVAGEKVYYVRGSKDNKPYSFYHIGDKDSGFNVWNVVLGNVVTPEEFSVLYQGGKIPKEKLTFNNGDSTSGTLYYDSSEKKIKAIFDKKSSVGEVVFDENGHNVKKFLSKDNLPYYKIDDLIFVNEVMFGHKMTIEDLKSLAFKGEVYITDFLSRKQTYFPGTLKVINNEIKLVFDD